MGFVIGGREIGVTTDGLIRLVDLVMGALGLEREGAEAELREMVASANFPPVRCLRRAGSVLVTSGGAEDVLVRLVKMGRGLKGPVVMAMRCFMSQNGPFAARIREGTESIPVTEVCAEAVEPEVCQWGEEPQSSGEWAGRLVGDTEWAHPVFIEQGGEGAKEAPGTGMQPLDRHRVRLTDLELDQLEGATETQAREAQREHYGKILGWYRELCEDAVVDDRARGVFQEALLGMLPSSGRSWADRRAREAWRRDVHATLG